jgi:hypothetical protein
MQRHCRATKHRLLLRNGLRALTIFAVCLITLPALAAQSAKQGAKINPKGYTSASVCGECHEDIYRSWKGSLHAISLQDPIFDAAFMQAIKVGGDEARRTCLRCHAPTTVVSGDYSLEEGVSREGVTCDFCHSVTAVHRDSNDKPYSSDPGRVKRSVLRNAASPAHEVAYSELHARAEFCGGCHNYVTKKGAAVLSTYDEWLAGPYSREGVQCQDCHMALRAGKVVRADIKKTGAEIHVHDLIHDSEQLRGALAVQITGARRTDHELMVDLVVENVGSGHMVPTGIPSRRIVLVVKVEGGGKTMIQERSYEKIVADERGRPLERDFETLLFGARILNDTRIAPREKRLERVTFSLPRGQVAKVSANLLYLYSAPILRDQQLKIELGKAERDVR